LGTIGGVSSYAYDINNAGQIVGGFETVGRPGVFIWENGSVTNLGSISESSVVTCTINNSGQVAGYFDFQSEDSIKSFLYSANSLTTFRSNIFIQRMNNLGNYVGQYYTPSGENHAFVQTTDGLYDLDLFITSDNYDSVANGINDHNQVVGNYSLTPFGPDHAFLWENGEITYLSTTDYDFSYAYAINNSGMIVGNGSNSEGQIQGYLWQNGSIVPLDVECAWDINNKGQILGGGFSLAVGDSTFLYEKGNYYKLHEMILNPEDWDGLYGVSINDLGQIVGCGDIDGQSHAFLMTPIPEPMTFTLLIFGGVIAYRKIRTL
jgi:probable HAF family extracellular repeat protein